MSLIMRRKQGRMECPKMWCVVFRSLFSIQVHICRCSLKLMIFLDGKVLVLKQYYIWFKQRTLLRIHICISEFQFFKTILLNKQILHKYFNIKIFRFSESLKKKRKHPLLKSVHKSTSVQFSPFHSS